MKNSLRVREFVALMLTALAGIGVAVLHGAMNFPALRARTALMDRHEAEVTEFPVIMETCCVFFSTIYFVGRFLSRHLINPATAERFHVQGRNHMRLIHILSGTFVVIRQTLLRPDGQLISWQSVVSLVIGLTFVVLAGFQREMPGWQTIFPQAPRV